LEAERKKKSGERERVCGKKDLQGGGSTHLATMMSSGNNACSPKLKGGGKTKPSNPPSKIPILRKQPGKPQESGGERIKSLYTEREKIEVGWLVKKSVGSLALN